MHKTNPWSLREIGRSLGGFTNGAVRAILFAVALITATLAVVKHFDASAKTRLSASEWAFIALGSALVSVAIAYHRARVERDSTRPLVRPDHLAELQGRLETLEQAVRTDDVCDYADPPDARETHEESFKAHYPALGGALDAWDAVVRDVACAPEVFEMALRDVAESAEPAAPWFGVYGPDNDTAEVLNALSERLEMLARCRLLGLDSPPWWAWSASPPLPSPGLPDHPAWEVMFGKRVLALIPEQPEDTRQERINEAINRIKSLWEYGEGMDEAAAIGATLERRAELKQPLLDELREWRKVSGVEATPRCSICRKNEGWHEPRPPIRKRIAHIGTGISSAVSRIFGRLTGSEGHLPSLSG